MTLGSLGVLLTLEQVVDELAEDGVPLHLHVLVAEGFLVLVHIDGLILPVHYLIEIVLLFHDLPFVSPYPVSSIEVEILHVLGWFVDLEP